MEKKEYSKLSKRCGNLLSLAQLWLGADHIILIEESTVSQIYRRFYFKDIEGIIISDSSRHIIYLIISIVLTIVMARVFSSTGAFADTSGQILSFSILALILLIGIWQIIGGRISSLSIQTKNGPCNLPIRMRHRKMKKLVNKVIPLINTVQLNNDHLEPITEETDTLEATKINKDSNEQ